MVSSGVLGSCTAEAYYETVEALKPPGIDADDEIHTPSGKEQSRRNLHTLTSSEAVVKSPDVKDEPDPICELPGTASEPQLKKRRRN
jgi:hypothetical protein